MYTRVIGVLDEEMVGTPYSLSESRVLFELTQADRVEVTDLRRILGLDAGYASRLLSQLETRGLIQRDRSPQDARRQVAWLTPAGRAAQAELDKTTNDLIGGLLDRLAEEDQNRLVGSMRTISRLVERNGERTVVLRPPRPGDLGWVVHRHGVLYSREYGWNAHFEALVARVVAAYLDGTDRTQAGWIAEVNGEPVGSVFCMPTGDPGVAQLRLLLVEPSARGLGVGRRLVQACLDHARGSGCRSLELWTMSALAAAHRIYQQLGFELVREERENGFGPELTRQFWRLTFPGADR
ncbi:MarR family transcriptional regulator [Pseudonocardiaceae bacterium YIM PH 21723]|nr:MarR family transcriptional regulator [Pseudonocardiaceae bacterium YIM PH 21723]